MSKKSQEPKQKQEEEVIEQPQLPGQIADVDVLRLENVQLRHKLSQSATEKSARDVEGVLAEIVKKYQIGPEDQVDMKTFQILRK